MQNENIPTKLRAGELTLVYEEGELRDIKFCDIPLLQRIHVAVRDQNWGTIPLKVERVNLQSFERSFTIDLDVSHTQGTIDYRWRARVIGSENNILFKMEGEAQSEFLKNRIGFCILHPATSKGSSCRTSSDTLEWLEGQFPVRVSPDAPFSNLISISHEFSECNWCKVQMNGDLFETEDQRNWTDASFKTFCTPLKIPFPQKVRPGDRIFQSIEVTLEINNPASAALGKTQTLPRLGTLPKLSLYSSFAEREYSELECSRIASLKLTSLRFDLSADDTKWERLIPSIQEQGIRTKTPIELSFFDPSSTADIDHLAKVIIQSDPQLARISLLSKTPNKQISPVYFDQLRDKLSECRIGLPFGTGTDYNFAELNRNRPETEGINHLQFSITPQIHAFDNNSMLETTQVYSDLAETVRGFAPDTSISASVVTLKPRRNAVATDSSAIDAKEQRRQRIDPRQCTLFAAVWTALCIRELSLARFSLACFYDTTGPEGVIPSFNQARELDFEYDAAYPVYHVFRSLAHFPEARVAQLDFPVESSIQGMTLSLDHRRRTLLWNQSNIQTVCNFPIKTEESNRLRALRLNTSTLKSACSEPEKFWAPENKTEMEETESVRLDGYEIVFIDHSTQ